MLPVHVMCHHCTAPISETRIAHGARFCSEQCRQRARHSTPEQKAANLARVLAWQAAHPEQTRQRKARWAALHPRRARNAQLRHRYGINLDDYEALLVSQGGRCRLCERPHAEAPKEKRLVVDHDHDTGKVRGLLCMRCNIALGYFRDPTWVARATVYLIG